MEPARSAAMSDPHPEINVALVRRLVAAQFPQWADLPIRPVEFDGWDNRTFHLGADMSVRLPSAAGLRAQVDKEHRWLPRLAPLLPLPIPIPLAQGVPGEGYPWPLVGLPLARRRDRDAGAHRRSARIRDDAGAIPHRPAAHRSHRRPAAGPHNF